jgi:hypothetical protein
MRSVFYVDKRLVVLSLALVVLALAALALASAGAGVGHNLAATAIEYGLIAG